MKSFHPFYSTVLKLSFENKIQRILVELHDEREFHRWVKDFIHGYNLSKSAMDEKNSSMDCKVQCMIFSSVDTIQG